MTINPERAPLVLNPIGYISTGLHTKFETPRQPAYTEESGSSEIELLPHFDFETALSDLEGFEYIWILFWFDRNTSWRPKVRPPRGGAKKRGVFATRSPHRPNPIGMSAVRLLEVSGRKLRIGACDLLDGTPILDIKPYIPGSDSFPDANVGWLQEVVEYYSSPPAFSIAISPRAEEQLRWLSEHEVHFFEDARKILERDPSEHKTRRIKRHGERLFRMGCAEWRIFFSLEGQTVRVEFITPGYTKEKLQSPGSEVIPNSAVQLQFLSCYAPDASSQVSAE